MTKLITTNEVLAMQAWITWSLVTWMFTGRFNESQNYTTTWQNLFTF